MHAQTLRLDDNLHRRTAIVCAATGQSQTAFIRQAVANEITRAANGNGLLKAVFDYLSQEDARDHAGY